MRLGHAWRASASGLGRSGVVSVAEGSVWGRARHEQAWASWLAVGLGQAGSSASWVDWRKPGHRRISRGE